MKSEEINNSINRIFSRISVSFWPIFVFPVFVVLYFVLIYFSVYYANNTAEPSFHLLLFTTISFVGVTWITSYFFYHYHFYRLGILKSLFDKSIANEHAKLLVGNIQNVQLEERITKLEEKLISYESAQPENIEKEIILKWLEAGRPYQNEKEKKLWDEFANLLHQHLKNFIKSTQT